MNIVLIKPGDPTDGHRVRVTGRRARHLSEVLGAKVGSTVRVGRIDGPLGQARVRAIDVGAAELECEWTHAAPEPWLHLVLAVPRPKQLKKLLPQVAALGLASLILTRTWRVQRPYLTSPLLRPDGYGPLIEDGLMQAGRTAWPHVERFERFESFCASVHGLPKTRLVAHPYAVIDLDQRTRVEAPVALFIGPEGGLLPFEVERLAEAGFDPIRSGAGTLRTDTACLVLGGQLDLLRRKAARR